ncbi:MAG: TylF/MycF family methyltransferase [Desmonostoc vinosum HA7617-LM4]|jgi:O-methyltransferase|nr:TylF/MycF family methyltransferase [Desmonostoc vinosum HA7617-LM4]
MTIAKPMPSLKRSLQKMVELLGYEIKKISDEEKLAQLYDKYSYYTMISKSTFINNLELSQSFNHIPGNVVECGVWRGGMIAAIAELLGSHRSYYLFDSFEGLPEAKEIDGKAAQEWQQNTKGSNYHDNCKAEIAFAEKAMQLSGSNKHQMIPGWFSETLPEYSPKLTDIAILRLDGDWYDSTMDCLRFLYPQVKQGGLIIIDDYYAWDGCSKAVHDYLSTHSLSDRIFQKENICYIVKS